MQFRELGLRIDGWADLVDGAGERANDALLHVADIIAKKGNPLLSCQRVAFSTGLSSPRERPFLLMKLESGAAITVHVGAVGKDLYASWNLYVRPVINWKVLGLMAGVAVGVNALLVLASLMAGFSMAARSFIAGSWVMLGSFMGGLLSFGITLALFFALAGILSRIVLGNALAFAFKELTPLDYDDIAAMALAVHHSMLRALDHAGVDIEVLRLKEQFRSGARERSF